MKIVIKYKTIPFILIGLLFSSVIALVIADYKMPLSLDITTNVNYTTQNITQTGGNTTAEIFYVCDNDTFHKYADGFYLNMSNISVCAGTDIIKMDGSGNWRCGADADSGGISWGNVTGAGIDGYFALWTNATDLNDSSAMFEKGGEIGIATTLPNSTLHVVGDFDLLHTSTTADDHAFEIDINAAGFGDVKAIDIFYDSGAISAGEEEAIILISIDESLSTGGKIFGIDILATEGSADIYGLKAGVLVGPIHQDSGTFGNMDSANNSGVDVLTNFTSSAADSDIFVNDNDYVTIGDAAKFEEIEFLLNTTASNPGIAPTFEYSTGVAAWSTFTPVDGTNGMKNTGIISWEGDDIPTWATGAGGEYLIRINRTQNNLVTVPKEDKVQISAVTEYFWDEKGNISAHNITANYFFGDGSGLTGIIDTTVPDTNATTQCGDNEVLDGSGTCITLLTNWNHTVPDTNITDTNATTQCGDNEVLDGSGTCITLLTNWNHTVPDTNITDTNATTQCGDNEVLDGSGTCITLLTNWNHTVPDTNITDTNASTACSVDYFLSGGAGGCIPFILDWNRTSWPDTNASTKCSTGEFLDGDGNCVNFLGFNSDTNITTDCSGDQLQFGSGQCYTQVDIWNKTTGNTTDEIFTVCDNNTFHRLNNTMNMSNITVCAGTQIMKMDGSGNWRCDDDSTAAAGGIGNITGAGAEGYFSVWTNTTDLNDSTVLFQKASKIGLGQVNPAKEFEVIGSVNATSGYCIGTPCVTDWASLVNTSAQMQSHNSDTNATTQCATGEFLDGDGNCVGFLGFNSNTNASTACSIDYFLSGGAGGCIPFVLDWNRTTWPDTNASAACGADQFLSGDEGCVAYADGWNRTDQGNTSAEIQAVVDYTSVCFYNQTQTFTADQDFGQTKNITKVGNITFANMAAYIDHNGTHLIISG